jgi:hypothetical protein
VRLDQIRLERARRFGDVWLGLRLWRALALDRFCDDRLVEGRERAPWPAITAILVIARLCEPASELHIAEDWYRRTALDDLLGVPAERVNDDRLYRALDRLLRHKQALETHLKERLGALFDLDYELLLYDVTSTYFEGQAEGNRLARRGSQLGRRGRFGPLAREAFVLDRKTGLLAQGRLPVLLQGAGHQPVLRLDAHPRDAPGRR